MEQCQRREEEHDKEWQKWRYQVGVAEAADSNVDLKTCSQDVLKAWILRRREVDKLQMDFWAEYASDIEAAKVSLATVACLIRDSFKPAVVDLLKVGDWVEDIVQWYADRVEKQRALNDAALARAKAEEEQKKAASQGVFATQGVAASQGRVWSARPRYSRFFNEAAGRPADAGPPGATCEQPQLEEFVDNDQMVKWWLDLGGYTTICQVDENGWTPLHHCVEAMVHWDQAWKIAIALIDGMAASQDGEKWLRAKTQKGQPPHRAALHMLACNSDRTLKKADIAHMLARKANEVDPTDDQGRTPLMHAVVAGLLDVAQALVKAGADPHLVSNDGRNIADRCTGSSGWVSKWVREELGIQPAAVEVHSRYRKVGAVSLSRAFRYHAKQAMDLVDQVVAEADQEMAAAASQDEAAAASQGHAPAAAASSSERPPALFQGRNVPRYRAQPWPTSPAAPPRERWTWFWDDRRQKWRWNWVE